MCYLGPILNETEWRKEYHPLAKEDICNLSEGRPNQSEGRKEISWIWRTITLDHINEPDQEHYREGVRVEWAKSRAHASRHSEEVSILLEEMLWVEQFFLWKAKDWETKGAANTLTGDSMTLMHVEGIQAYAKRQAALYRDLNSYFKSLWQNIPAHIARMQAIIQKPEIARPGELEMKKAWAKVKKNTKSQGR